MASANIKDTPTEAWRCNECGSDYDDEDEARECCQPSITEGWRCPTCLAFKEDENEARECCHEPDADDDQAFPRISAIDLERHGQMRLLP